MAVDMLKMARMWLLTGAMALAPGLCVEATPHECESVAEDAARAFNPFAARRLQVQSIAAWETLVIDLHDVGLENMWSLFPNNFSSILERDSNTIVNLFEKANPDAYVPLKNLIQNYLFNGFEYSFAVSQCPPFVDSNAVASQWLLSGREIARFLNALYNPSRTQAQRLEEAFAALTQAQIDAFRNAGRNCSTQAPINVAASNDAYERARALAVPVADTMAKIISKLQRTPNF